MPIHRKTVFTLMVIFAFLLIVAGGFFFTVPPILDSNLVKERLLAEIEARTGTRANYSGAVTRFFPIPSVTLQEGSLDAPYGVRVSFRTLKVTPKILPLFVGRLRLDALHLDSPIIGIRLSLKTSPDQEEEKFAADSPPRRDLLAFGGAILPLAVHDVSLSLANGEIHVDRGEGTFLSVAVKEGYLASRSGNLSFRLDSASNVWKRLALEGKFHLTKWTARGQLVLEGFLPETLVPVVFPRLPLAFPRSEINLKTVVEALAPRDFLVTYSASVPSMTLRRGAVEEHLSGSNLQGSVRFQAGRNLEILLEQAHFDAPRFALSGRYSMDFTAPDTHLELKGKDVDAEGFGRVFLVLFGNNRTIQRIFEIIRGGRVPSIEFVSHGRNPRELHKTENFLIRGNMTDGRIFVPEVELDVEEASGDVVISKGVMEGTNLQGRSGKSLGRSGSLTIGFKRDRYGNAPFKLDIELDADLAELPPVLQRVVRNEDFLHEIGLIEKIQGRARGRLLLGDSFKSVQARVEAKEFATSALYKRIPYPIDVRGEDFVYEEDRVSIGLAQGSIGQSKLSGVSGSLNWHEESTLHISAASPCSVSLEDVFLWLVSYENLRERLKNYDFLKGILHLETLDLKGPTRRAQEWRFVGRGSLENFIVSSSYASKPLEIRTGRVEATQDQLQFQDCNASLLDASLLASGILKGFWSDLTEMDLSVGGTVSPSFNQWLTTMIPGKHYVELRSPYTISQGRFLWYKEGRFGFAGSLTTPEGTVAQLDLMKDREGLIMRQVRISDPDSEAEISAALKEGLLSIGMDGNLSSGSLSRLLVDNPVRGGRFHGSLHAVISLENPAESQVHGDFKLQGLQYSGSQLSPLFVEHLSGSAAGNSFRIQQSRISWQGVPMEVSGRASFSRGACNLDLDLRADRLEWDVLFPTHETSKGDDMSGEKPRRQSVHLLGTVRVTSGSFIHGKTRWEPFKGELQLNQHGFLVTVADSKLCGIPLQGQLELSGQDVELKVKPLAKHDDLDATVSCLWDKPGLVKGTYGLTGDLEARGDKETLRANGILRSLKGNLQLDAEGGRIYRLGLLAKILSVLNVTEIYRGKLPDLVEQGFEYDTIKGRGALEGGKLHLEEFIIAAPSMKMFWQGEVDLAKNEVNLTLLIAPLRTFDRVIDNVPLVGSLIGGSVISIPVQVTGNADDPTVIPLSPSAVGSKLLGHVKRVFRLPLRLIQPLR
ncbi:MAG: hypothetical protein GX443_00420 [Deltaproteobacteria bacterium]|nr:hypothetical protein [Deltaproteobacteria bacterium]